MASETVKTSKPPSSSTAADSASTHNDLGWTEFLGEYTEAQASRQRLLGLTAFSLLGIVLLLYSNFQNMRSVLLICLTLPVALVGGIGGAFLSGGVISFGSFIGLATVLEVAARNGIMLMEHYRHLQR